MIDLKTKFQIGDHVKFTQRKRSTTSCNACRRAQNHVEEITGTGVITTIEGILRIQKDSPVQISGIRYIVVQDETHRPLKFSGNDLTKVGT